jgi:DNA polymerase III alpha subunit
MSFIHLHCHSSYSFYAGVASVPELVSRAKARGYTALALTDTDTISGLILFYCACRDAGIKPILGVELIDPHTPGENVVLLAKNAAGYGDICELITDRHLDTSFSFEKVFAKTWENLFFITASARILLHLNSTPNRSSLYAEAVRNSPQSVNRSRELMAIARAQNIPVVASNNCFFCEEADWQIHKTLAAIGRNATLSRLSEHEYAPQEALLAPAHEMLARFPDCQEALTTSATIAAHCDCRLSLGTWIMPQIQVPAPFTPESFLKK